MSDEILIERQGALGIITMNRPQALNTLSLAMYRRFDPALMGWAEDTNVRAVLVRGAGERAFCAGGDVVAIYEVRGEAVASGGYKSDFFREEYRLIRRIHRFPKPYIALMDGITMGGGAGVAVNGRFRIATARTVLAMPEVHIGLFPDVGATRFLALAPGRTGLYLALTGTRIGAADALYCGFATHFMAHEREDELLGALAALDQGENTDAAVAAVLHRFAADPGSARLPPLRAAIDRVFTGGSVEAIMAALAGERDDWAREALAAMRRASPLSLKLVFRQLAEPVPDLEAALTLEYRMTQHVMAGHDFFEGIRAALVDKDRNPVWQHRTPEEVSAAEVDAYFAPIGDRELTF
ncbi:MAG TPA: enoyl-CoA hydratase/isomerase family protein [Stellaceae bacterium]|nr:enoyl-CoA hydratase/isomerase family protein [Stellaceae bacterium]